MKKSTVKLIVFCLITLNIAVIFCEMQNVKIILDETAPLGVELDFSEAQFALKHQAPNTQFVEEVAMP